MALGKLLTSTVLVASLVGCAGYPMQNSDSIRRSAAAHYDPGFNSINLAINLWKWNVYTLTAEQKRKQNAAVYAALESDYGIVYKWHEDNAQGSVKAVQGYPINSGFCRVVYSLIEVKGQSRHFEETACQSTGHDGWRFVGR